MTDFTRQFLTAYFYGWPLVLSWENLPVALMKRRDLERLPIDDDRMKRAVDLGLVELSWTCAAPK